MPNLNGIEQGTGNVYDLREIFDKTLSRWRVFLVFFILCIVLAYVYLKYANEVYSAETTILIKNDKKDGVSEELAAFKDIGLLGSNVNKIENEVEILKSRKLIASTIKDLDLNIKYISHGRIHNQEVYNKTPYKIIFIEKSFDFYERDTILIVQKHGLDSLKITNSEQNKFKYFGVGEIITDNLGIYKIVKNQDSKYDEITVQISKINRVIDNIKSKFDVKQVSKNSSVLKLNFKDQVRRKSEDYLDNLVKQYNLDAIQDKNLVSLKTKNLLTKDY